MSKFGQQRAFDDMVTHLRQQGVRSTTRNEYGDSICAYRGEEGRKCAVGALIADEHYQKSLEGSIGNCAEVVNAVNASGYDIRYAEAGILALMQGIHDNVYPDKWEDTIRDLAKQQGLKYTPPEAESHE